MKQVLNVLPVLLLFSFFTGCKKNEIEQYKEKEAVYFLSFNANDSIVYSFAGKTKKTDTLYLDVKLLGNKLNAGKKYKIVVRENLTTAKEGIHYKKPEDHYVFPADTFDGKLPIVVYNKDEALSTRSVKLDLEIISTDELNAGYPSKSHARIVITNQLVKPVYWNGLLVIFYGEYSKVKHETCIRLQGHDFPISEPLAMAPPYSISYWMSYGRIAAKYFTDNIVYDENGNRIMPWAAL